VASRPPPQHTPLPALVTVLHHLAILLLVLGMPLVEPLRLTVLNPPGTAPPSPLAATLLAHLDTAPAHLVIVARSTLLLI